MKKKILLLLVTTEQDGKITTSSIQKTREDKGNLSSLTEPPCTFLSFIWFLHQLINVKIKIQRKLDSKFFHEHFLQKPLERVLFVSDWYYNHLTMQVFVMQRPHHSSSCSCRTTEQVQPFPPCPHKGVWDNGCVTPNNFLSPLTLKAA